MPNYRKIIEHCNAVSLLGTSDFEKWRYCYEAGDSFLDKYLERFSDREKSEEFERRKKLTPVSAYAQLEINKIRNSISQRLGDISRTGGSKIWDEAISGRSGGVDRRGASMNSFLNRNVLAESLVMQKVGILVDAPRVEGVRAVDVPDGFRPYLSFIRREAIKIAEPAPIESVSDWSCLLLEDQKKVFDVEAGNMQDTLGYLFYWLDKTRNDLVTFQRLDRSGKEVGGPVYTNLKAIPFVVVDIQESLMRKVCSHQITMLNMASADSSYSIDANFPLLVRQRGNAVSANHLVGEDEVAEVGPKKGLFYDRGLNAPAYISPPSEPLALSLELRREMKAEIRDMIHGTLADLGDGSMDAGLAFIGNCLHEAERRVWDHWTSFESSEPSKRKIPIIDYPETWTLKTDEERIAEAVSLLDLVNRLPGQDGKKRTAQMVYDKMFRGKVTTEDLNRMKSQIDSAPFTTSDPEIVRMAVENGLVGPQTASISLGYRENEYLAAQREQERKAAALVKAQSKIATLGGSTGSVPGKITDAQDDPRVGKLAREGDVEEAKLKGEKGQRGEE